MSEFVTISSTDARVASIVLRAKGKVRTSVKNHYLIVCVRSLQFKAAELLLKNGASPDWFSRRHRKTAMQWAIHVTSIDMIRMLLDNGVHAAARNGYYLTAYHLALEEYFEETDPDLKPHRMAVVRVLLAHGKMCTSVSDTYRKLFALSEAVIEWDREAIVEIASNVDDKIFLETKEYYQPAVLACYLRRPELTRLLLKHHRDPKRYFMKLVQSGNPDIMEVCLDLGMTGRQANPLRRTALHTACVFGSPRLVKLLLSRTENDPEAQDDNGDTPLMLAAEEPGTRGGEKGMRLILEAYEIINVNLANHQGLTLLHYVSDRCEEYALVLERGAHPVSSTGPAAQGPPLHSCYQDCEGNRTLKKLDLIDPKFFPRDELHRVPVDPQLVAEYEREIEALKKRGVSRGMARLNRNEFDVMFLKPNQCARYAGNVNLGKTYEDNERDFAKLYPHYGFVLNYQFRRGARRRCLMEQTGELLDEAFGTYLPLEIQELVMEHFSDKGLKRLLEDSNNN